MAAMVDRRRSVRSGSLSSESGSSESEEENRGTKLRSAIVQPVEGFRDARRAGSPEGVRKGRRRRGLSYSPPRSGSDGAVSPLPPSGHRLSPDYSRRERRRRRRRSLSESPPPPPHSRDREETKEPPVKRKKEEEPLMTRTGGAYIPPARLRMMQEQMTDKSSVAYQRLSWEALKKSINGLVNKVNVSNIANIIQELFQENIVRGRGLLARSLIQAQTASPSFTHVYAAVTAIVNTKFPQTGELIARRLLVQFRKGFRRNDKTVCVTAAQFLAHLVNQQVLHELVALELLTLLLEDPTDDSVEVAIGFLKECGLKLSELSPRGAHAVYETLRTILHSGKITARVQYMIEVMFAIRKDKFKDHPSVVGELDLVQEDDQITHLLSLADEVDTEEELNVFRADPDFVANEEKYKTLKSEILGEEESSSGSSGEGSEEDDEDSEEEGEGEEGAEGGVVDILDKTDAKALALRRQIYLTIMSSLDYEECAHKLMKSLPEGQEYEVAFMVIECCSQERSYLRFYGLLGQRFCQLNQAWVEQFDNAFQQQYATVHRLETNKLRNIARFFAQLFYMDALPWTCMSCIHLNEEETNSSSRIFVKIMFQELAEFMGMPRLNERLRDPLLALAFEGLLPRDNPKNTRFAINFFTSIGLGGLTDDLREHLKNAQKLIMAQKQEVSSSDTSSSSDDTSESDSGDSSSDSEETSSSSSEDERERRHRREKEREKKRGRGGERRREEKGRERDEGEKGRERDKEKEKKGERGREKRREEKGRERDEGEKGREKREERGRERRREEKKMRVKDDEQQERDDSKERGRREHRSREDGGRREDREKSSRQRKDRRKERDSRSRSVEKERRERKRGERH